MEIVGRPRDPYPYGASLLPSSKMAPNESKFFGGVAHVAGGLGLAAASWATRPKQVNMFSMATATKPISAPAAAILGGISGAAAAAAPFVGTYSFLSKAPKLLKGIGSGVGVGAMIGAGVGGAIAGPINTFLTPFNIKRAERGQAPLSAAPIANISAGIGTGIGSMVGAAAGGNPALAGFGLLTSVSMLATGVGNLAKSMHATVQSAQGNRPFAKNGRIQGSYNTTRQDKMHTAYLPQSLHKVRHRRVL